MSDTKPVAPSRSPVNQLFLVPYLEWVREGRETFERQRAALVDTLMLTVRRLLGEAFPPLDRVLLSGQTVIIEDTVTLRPDLLPMLVMVNGNGKAEIGPWYVHVDDTLVSGEALIRNLLLAREDAEKYGITLAHVAYTPHPGGHIAQLPQILRGFGMFTAFLHHGAPVLHLPFRWEAPDGTSVLVISHEHPPQNVVMSLRKQRVTKPDGPYLWMMPLENAPDMPDTLSIPTRESSLLDYVNALRLSMPDNNRPALRGELRIQSSRTGGYLLPGTLSARLYLKQRNAELENLLSYAAEPLFAVALSHGKIRHPHNVRAVLENGWRTLVRSQATLGGHAADAVHDETLIRTRQAEDNANIVIEKALSTLPGMQRATRSLGRLHVLVWNAHNWLVRQVVSCRITLPEGQHPARLITPSGEELLFGWNPDTETISFLADVPPVGYSVYALEVSDKPPAHVHLSQYVNAHTIADAEGATLNITDGVISWRRGQHAIEDLLRFYDGGDAGDTYNYSPPQEDIIEQAILSGGAQVESSPLYERLILRHRMRVAPSLNASRNRERGVRLIEMTTTATFYDGMPGLYFHTTFTNTAQDHRLRVHLRTGIQSESVYAGSAFAVIQRKLQQDGEVFAPRPYTEGVINTYPMQGVSAVSDTTTAIGLVARGLPEFEALPEDHQVTLALTLLRAVGWGTRADLRTRAAAIGGKPFRASGAQCERVISAEYALMPLPAHDPAAMIRAGQAYNAPLRAFQVDAIPDKMRRSYLSVMTDLGLAGESDGNGAILTAFKPPQNGRGWLLRLFNPTGESVEARVTPFERTRYARLLNMAEEPQAIIEPDGNGSITVVLKPHSIVTLRLGFS